MKREYLEHAMNEISDAHIEEAVRAGRKRKPIWVAATAAVAVLALAAGFLLWPGGNPLVPEVHAICQAEYPQMAPYPNEADYTGADGNFDDASFSRDFEAWWNDQRARQDQKEGYAEGLTSFFDRSIRQFLTGAEGENRVYSPLNVYMALAMLAELTEGESRQQILDLLGTQDLEALRTQAAALWNANYSNDGANTSILASSLWLRDDMQFVPSTMDTLARVYYTSSYQGPMGSEEMNRALQDWLNEQTGGLLTEQSGGVELDPDTILALATTIYFQAKWSDQFSESATQPAAFHGLSGDVTCDFMHQRKSGAYCWGERFSAASLPLTSGGAMWFLLPDEGVTVDELLEDPEAMDFLLSGGQWEQQKHLTINMSVPKFDVSSDLNLAEGLQALGVTDVFDPEASDFSPATIEADGIYVSKVAHAVRVMIDELGCTAAAYTVIATEGAGMPPEEEVDFTLDRPFLFVVTGAENVPLFAGVVHQPAAAS